MFLLPFKLLCLVVALVVASPATPQSPRVEISVEDQLKFSINLCTYEMAPPWSDLPVGGKKAGIVVVPFPPTKGEYSRWDALPATMTSSNHLLGHSVRAQRYANVSVKMWQLPLEHKRQDRLYCTDLSRKVSREYGTGGLDLYKSNASMVKSSTFFVAQMRDVVIQEQGVVVMDCSGSVFGKLLRGGALGYYQPIASCETFYKFIGKRFTNGCSRNLTAHGVGFSDLMRDSVRHGTTCFPQDVIEPGWLNKRKKKDEDGNLLPPRPRVTRDVHLVTYDQVFMATAGWDHNYHHFIIDSLTRIVRHLQWLKTHPDVKIHIRGYERILRNEVMIEAGMLLREQFWELLGIDRSRLVTGNVAARIAYVPRESKCNDPLEMAYEVRILAEVMKRAANARLMEYLDKREEKNGARERRRLAAAGGREKKKKPRRRKGKGMMGGRRGKTGIGSDFGSAVAATTVGGANEDDYIDDDGLERGGSKGKQGATTTSTATASSSSRRSSSGTSSKQAQVIPEVLSQALDARKPIVLVQQRSCEGEPKTWREWNDTMAASVVEGFRQTFPSHLVILLSDTDPLLKRCVWCQIVLYQKANVLVGIHGAGLTNIMFMPPNSLLVEITGEFDGRMAPVCGYHGPLAAAFGVHHYLWLWVWKITMKHPPNYPSPADFLELGREARTFHATLPQPDRR